MNISGKQALAIVVVAVLFVGIYGTFTLALITDWQPPWVPVDDDDDDDVELSSFKVNGVREDATSTSVTSATARVWYDENEDGVMQYSELGSLTESSGVYTTVNEDYPIGEDFEFWVQIYASAHWVTYQQVHMTGVRNSDGAAKLAGVIELRQIDDALTWSGDANGAAFDTTDYNASVVDGIGTGAGESGTLDAEMILSAADKGLASQIWNIDYETVYGIDANIVNMDYFIKWDSITEGLNDAISVADSSILAETFFCAYSTVADKNELVIDLTDFSHNYQDGTNWYCIKNFGSIIGDVMYNTDDANAPRPHVLFSFGPATAAGTFLATYGIGCWYDVRYDQMGIGSWTKGTALALGTCGDAWGWTHT